MKLITRNELQTLLLKQTRATIVSIIGVTPPDMRAKNAAGEPNPYRIGRGENARLTIGKVNKIQGRIGTDYDSEVTNQLTKEIEAERIANGLPTLNADELNAEIDRRFTPGTSWHRPMFDASGKPTVLSVHKKHGENGGFYLRYMPSAKGEAEYLRLDDGSTVDSEAVAPFLSPTSTYSNQGAEKPRIFLVYALENIVEIRINGERYRISDNFTDRPMEMRNRIWTIADEYVEGERTMTKV